MLLRHLVMKRPGLPIRSDQDDVNETPRPGQTSDTSDLPRRKDLAENQRKTPNYVHVDTKRTWNICRAKKLYLSSERKVCSLKFILP